MVLLSWKIRIEHFKQREARCYKRYNGSKIIYNVSVLIFLHTLSGLLLYMVI